MANSVAHFALQADQLERARSFYEKVFGWRFEPWGPPGYFKIYTGEASDPGVTEGALSERRANAEEVPINAFRCSISVSSIEETVGAIQAHGGQLQSPVVEIPEVGSVVQFADPEGNIVAAVQYHADDRRAVRATGLVGEVGASPRLYRVVLPAGEMEASVGFYRRLLEMEGERVSSGRHYFTCGGVILAVVDPRADGDDRDTRPNADHVYLAVGDLEIFHQRAADLEALSPVMGAIETRPWGERSFYARDPFGNPLCFVEESTLFLGHTHGEGER